MTDDIEARDIQRRYERIAMARKVVREGASIRRIAGILVVVALISVTAVAVISPDTVAVGLGAAYSFFYDIAASVTRKS